MRPLLLFLMPVVLTISLYYFTQTKDDRNIVENRTDFDGLSGSFAIHVFIMENPK